MMSKLDDFLKKNRNKKIVFTNGCFDIIHRGHVHYLNEAKLLGDLLILGLNSDRSVKTLKGPSRPINTEEDRMFVLENLNSVDFVEIFNEDTPLELIKRIAPDVLVKGGDYTIEDIVGSKEVLSRGGLVKVLSFVQGQSTTNIIEKISSK